MSKSLIEVKNAVVGYDHQPILSDLSLTINSGEFVAIVGPNGSGKTALIKTLLGLQPLISGQIFISGETPEQVARKRRGSLGYVPQHAQLNLNSPMTGREFVALKGAENTESVLQFAATLGLSDSNILDKPLQKLSVGQRQRILVAFALAGEPSLVCLDEATDGLDFKAQKEFFEHLRKIQSQTKTTILFISHDITAVGNYANRVICLNRSLLFDGNPNSPEFHSCLHNIYGKESFIHHHDHGHKH